MILLSNHRPKKRSSTAAVALGTHFAMCVLVGAGIGWWLEETFSWKPWGIVGGLVLGFLAGCWELYKSLAVLPEHAEDIPGGSRDREA